MAEHEQDAGSPGTGKAPEDAGGGSVAATKVRPKPKRKPKHERKELPPYNVILLNDDDHSYEYVIEMLGKVFGYAAERAFAMAQEVDKTGRVIVLTTHKEKAELKRDQIVGYGPDARIARCNRSMDAVIEPAEG
ncbi:MAG TPA: ATP-dependent Clp protease adaptor ClpS [Humisphaera sp.]